MCLIPLYPVKAYFTEEKSRPQRDSVVRIVTGPLLGQSGFPVTSLSHKSRPAVGTTQPSSSMDFGGSLPGIKHPAHEVAY